MTDKMREEFEQWMAVGAGVELWKVESARNKDGSYALRDMTVAWDAWKASRESLVIDFTYCVLPHEFFDAVKDASLKVKP